jgi:hypothetical protein
MRVRMLIDHTESCSDTSGVSALLYPAGSVQAFAEPTATALVAAKQAELVPDGDVRVRLLRTIMSVDGRRLAKGELVHFPKEDAAPLLAGDEFGPIAELAPDPDHDPIAASRAAAIARAKEAGAQAAARTAATDSFAARRQAARARVATPATPAATTTSDASPGAAAPTEG